MSDTPQNTKALLAEYKEASQDVREGWRYTTEIVRRFFTFQIAITIAVISKIAFQIATPRAIENKVDIKMESIQDGVSIKYYIITFLFMSVLINIATIFQFIRIFKNSEIFVERAKHIEEALGLKDLGGSMPLHTYMHNRLKNTPWYASAKNSWGCPR